MTLFNPNQYYGKEVYYVKVPNAEGICRIWDWNSKRQKYSKRETGNLYYVYKRVHGHQHSKCFKTFEEAKTWRDHDSLYADDANAREINFRELCQRYLKHKEPTLRVSTFETVKSQMKHLSYFEDFPVLEITPKAIDAWLRQVKSPEYVKVQHGSRTTYHHELSVLRCVLTYYSEYENDSYQVPVKKRHREDAIVDHERYRQAKDKGKVKYIPEGDFKRFLTELSKDASLDPIKEVLWVIAEFQLGAGTRIGETCAIQWEDSDLKTGQVMISKTVEWARSKGRSTCISPLTKTGQSREIYVTHQALEVLRNWRLKSGRSKGLIFSYDGVTPLPYRTIQFQYDNVFKKLGLSWRSTHILRHSYATNFLEKTGNKEALQAQLGHAHSKQTDHYAKITDATKRKGVHAYSESLKLVDQEKPDLLGVAGNDEFSKRKSP